MTQYEPTQRIIELSVDELSAITQYLHENKGENEYATTVLIGGWAVDSYNPWFGSVDIDIITNNQTRKSLMHYLRNHRGFVPYRLPGLSTSVKKQTEAGPIIIDFATRKKLYPFEGVGDISLDFSILDGNTETRQIRGGIKIAVPNRTTLLVLKLKAIWDRQYRIENRKSDDFSWETGKLVKDHADILALIDPNHGGKQLDIYTLGELLKKYAFLEQSLLSVYRSNEGIEKYGRMSQNDAKEIIEQMIALIH